MNLTTLREATREYIQDTIGVRWDVARVDRAINNKYFEAQGALNHVRPGYFDSGALINLVAGQIQYPQRLRPPHLARLKSHRLRYRPLLPRLLHQTPWMPLSR